MSFIPLTNYQIQQVKKYFRYLFVITFALFLTGNIIKPLIKQPLRTDRSAYILNQGFPLFLSSKAYISTLKHYDRDPGVAIKYHVMQNGESFWDIAQSNNITIDTLIAANPFLTSLVADEGIEIAIPAQDGVLFACDDTLDAFRMGHMLGREKDVKGAFLPGPFDFLSMDDIRFAFISNVRPVIVNSHLAGLFEIKKTYNVPCPGQLASMYGLRIDPFLHTPDFHGGIDIRSPYGTPVRPVKEGMVIQTGWRGGYGNCIEIVHDEGYSSVYGHLSAIKVEKGMIVGKNDIIGYIGSTGRSTGPHLHFEMRRHGENLNPLFFVW
jgi:hypothetical protein